MIIISTLKLKRTFRTEKLFVQYFKNKKVVHLCRRTTLIHKNDFSYSE